LRTERPDRPGRGDRRSDRARPPGPIRRGGRPGGPGDGGRTKGSGDGGRPGGPGRGGRGGGPERRGAPAPDAIGLASGFELVYGRNAVAEALRGRRQARRLFLAEGVREDERVQSILARAEERGLAVERPPRALLDDLARGANHQGIGLEASGYSYAEFDEVVAAPGTVLVLDHLQDPQNFGTLLRAAEAAAVAGVVIPQDRAVAVSPAVVNASAGAVEHLRVALVPNLARALDSLKRAGRWVVGLDDAPGAANLFETEVPTPVAMVVGGEGTGIGQNVRNHCDLLVSLPMRGKVASLNAATAGAIALYELLRREPALATPTVTSNQPELPVPPR